MPLILLFKHFLECFGSTMQRLTAFLVRVEFADPSLSKIGVKKGNLRDIIETGQDSVCGVGRKQIIPGAGCSSSSSATIPSSPPVENSQVLPRPETPGVGAPSTSLILLVWWKKINCPPTWCIDLHIKLNTLQLIARCLFLSTRNRLKILQVSLIAG